MSRISPHAFAPHCLVETSVNANIRSAHLLHGELADFLDGPWSPSLETPARGTICKTFGRLKQHLLGFLGKEGSQSVVGNGWQKKSHAHGQAIVYSKTYVHSMDALVDIDGILSCNHLVDG